MLSLLLALAVADPVTIELHYMPEGKKVYLPPPDNTWGKGFNFEEYKLLLGLDNDLWAANQSLGVCRDMDLNYQAVVRQKDVIIKTLQDDNQVLNERLKRSDANWHAAEEKLVEASGGPVWPYILAAGGAVVGIVGATLYLSTSMSH
jgi:hypothetical protein